jgi:CHASE2 domain-containing sensor protein
LPAHVELLAHVADGLLAALERGKSALLRKRRGFDVLWLWIASMALAIASGAPEIAERQPVIA